VPTRPPGVLLYFSQRGQRWSQTVSVPGAQWEKKWEEVATPLVDLYMNNGLMLINGIDITNKINSGIDNWIIYPINSGTLLRRYSTAFTRGQVKHSIILVLYYFIIYNYVI
jgi:hypothetical protein